MSSSEPGGHFSDRAADYRAYRPAYPARLARFLASIAPRARLAWEAGCGSGQLTLPLAIRFERVIATDASAEQISRAPAHERVEYWCAPAEASGLPGGVADLAVAAQAAHWFDLPSYYDEVRRVVGHGGAVALVSYGRASVGPEIDPILHAFQSDVLRPYWRPERRHVDTGLRDLPFPFRELEAPRLELRALWTLERLLGYVGTWSAVGALTSVEGPAALEELGRELRGSWGNAERRTVRWPLSLRVGRV